MPFYDELGRVPLSVIRKERILNYWFKIMKSPGSLIYKVFQDQNVDGTDSDSWSSKVQSLLSELGFAYVWNDQNVTKLQLKCIKERIHGHYYQSWYAALNISRKLSTYNMFKTQIGEEKYLSCMVNTKYRVALTKFRISAHRLGIEEGRFRNIIRNERFCIYCNMRSVEDENHFLLICPYYYEIRTSCLPRYFCTWPTINDVFSTNWCFK